MSFLHYVKNSQARDNPQGDFKRDARDDSSFPDAKSWDELDFYLRTRGACSEAIEAGKIVWKAYQASAKK